ncbi:CBS domain-containing protein [Aneurinibacillus sp. Ricciae_BoGa-3]|uniref:CBS domain-containing protein n=1 Tax=Aneurinibacillus sp. Ricciae_BoGa-3 TaxID=3022697 RepID=UPI00233F881A|nr:CBS domain-containing protein [Aneurinibacillus sp. Ricciae_BoGa-3]WCK56596.1 CBS domain-containing protein [Aneurinibacillus sp. Ricciae_BoGa-3]
MKIMDFMIKDVISVQETASVKELLQTLVNHKVGGVPVLNAEGKLTGMVSDGDIIRFMKPKDQRVYDFFSYVVMTNPETLEATVDRKLEQNVTKVMKKTGLFTVAPEDDLEKAMTIFSTHHFKKIPVIDAQKNVAGVVSRGDIIRQLAQFILNAK